MTLEMMSNGLVTITALVLICMNLWLVSRMDAQRIRYEETTRRLILTMIDELFARFVGKRNNDEPHT